MVRTYVSMKAIVEAEGAVVDATDVNRVVERRSNMRAGSEVHKIISEGYSPTCGECGPLIDRKA